MAARLVFIFILMLQLSPFGGEARAAEIAGSVVQLTILADEGLLIRSADAGILIDAFIDVGEAEGDLLAGRPPFSSINLAIVSHPHSEHFDAVTAGTFVKNNTEAILASTEEVVQAIRADYPEYSAIQNRLRAITSDGATMTSMTISGIRLDFMLFDHEASGFYPERVLPHIIHLAGKKILYIGDSEMRPENWRPYNLAARKIDIVILPLWLFKEESVRKIIDDYITPGKVVVAEIPVRGPGLVDELSKTFPDVVFLCTPMASVEF